MRQLRALPPTLLAACALLLTACDPFVSPIAEPPPSPATGSSSTSTTSPSSAPASPSSPADQASPAAATSTPDVPEATAGGVLTVNPEPAPLVPAWGRYQLYELSFVLPAEPDKLQVEDDPVGYSYYSWNMGSHLPKEPPLGMSVESSATDRATAPEQGRPYQESVSTLTLPGADDAWLAVYRYTAATPTESASHVYIVWINTATRMYRMEIGVPLTDEGAEVARAAIASLHLTTG